MGSLINWVNTSEMLAYLPKIHIMDCIEILILTVIIYYMIRNLIGTRAWVLLKGVVALLFFYALAYTLDFTIIVLLFNNALLFIGIALVLIIQPELRKFIENIGTKNINISLMNVIDFILKDRSKERVVMERISDKTMKELADGCFEMGEVKTGALIVIEGDIPLNEYVTSGIELNADITSQLLINIFEKNTPLHDGAVIIQHDKITAATCYLPLSDSRNINKALGTRHRAGIGISECTDSMTIIVSEETGNVSVAYKGTLYGKLNRDKLMDLLKEVQSKEIKIEDRKRSGKSMIVNDLPMKLGCLFSTFIIWMILITASNPIISTTFYGVPIELKNTDAITDIGKTFEITTSNTVNVMIKDTKDIVDRIKASDIKVVADFSNMTLVDSIPLQVIVERHPNMEVKISDPVMKISMEDIVTAEIGVNINRIGNENKNYYISGIELDNNIIMVSGGKSVISTIGSAVINLDQSKLKDNEELKLTPVIYDKNGSEIDSKRLSLNVQTITATVHLYKTKRVPLEVNTKITSRLLAQIVTNIDYEQKFVYITGEDEAIENYDSISVTVPIDLSLGDFTKRQFIKTILVSEYLEQSGTDGDNESKEDEDRGIIIMPDYDKVTLTIDFIEFFTSKLEFNSSAIEFTGVSVNRSARILENKDFAIDIIGVDSRIENLEISDIGPYIDISKLENGENSVRVKFKQYNENIFGELDIKIYVSITPADDNKISELNILSGGGESVGD